MRILVISDTHGHVDALSVTLNAEPRAEVVFHLGDGEEDAYRVKNAYPDKLFLQVRGNNDWGSDAPAAEIFMAMGVRIFYTHGHTYQVKYGETDLLRAARERKADIVLYGHTHTAVNRYEDGLYIMNPGALGGYDSSYGTIEITERGILTNLVSQNRPRFR